MKCKSIVGRAPAKNRAISDRNNPGVFARVLISKLLRPRGHPFAAHYPRSVAVRLIPGSKVALRYRYPSLPRSLSLSLSRCRFFLAVANTARRREKSLIKPGRAIGIRDKARKGLRRGGGYNLVCFCDFLIFFASLILPGLFCAQRNGFHFAAILVMMSV